MSIIELSSINKHYLIPFLQNDFPPTFRYFNNKSVEQITKNHYKTLLYVKNDAPIGYAHIDYDIVNDKYWFGICILSEHLNKGIGKLLITNILTHFTNATFDSLHLTVDKTNIIAYNLYLKYGFKVLRETPTIYIMCLTKSNILYLPVSFGEAIDKLTILDIKMNKITDSRKYYVENEYNTLFNQLHNLTKSIQFYYNALKQINLQIWNDQDTFRYSINDEEKNNLCKKIIEDNDARFRIKNKINNLLQSSLKEQKGYTPKVVTINYIPNSNYLLLNSVIKYQSIFNDKVVVVCISEDFENIKKIFNYDSTIDIVPVVQLDMNPSYVESLENTISNKSFFEFIQDTQ
jgi:GNAT superfamily N-acetyltransferase